MGDHCHTSEQARPPFQDHNARSVMKLQWSWKIYHSQHSVINCCQASASCVGHPSIDTLSQYRLQGSAGEISQVSHDCKEEEEVRASTSMRRRRRRREDEDQLEAVRSVADTGCFGVSASEDTPKLMARHYDGGPLYDDCQHQKKGMDLST